MPQPYTRSELRDLRLHLDAEWPLLDDGSEWIRRWRQGISPYSRVRSHAIRLQLDAIVSLALHCGLRRAEIRDLTVVWMHYDNVGVVVWETPGPWDGEHREVAYSERVRHSIGRWLEFRALLGPDHDSPWLNLWAETKAQEPMRADAFNRLLRTYVSPDVSFRRLRDTCAVGWLNAGLPLEHVRRLLGLSTIEATLPYARLVSGTLEHRMRRVADNFAFQVAA